jgi:hypothetical protein
MEPKRTFGNFVMIKLDKENTSIKLKDGFELYVDTTFEPEKHATVTGIVQGLPSRLEYSGKPNIGMAWKTDMELRFGDHVIMYYLSVVNALKKEHRRYVLQGEDRYVFIPYENIYAVYGEGFIKPINGYILVEPCDDPALLKREATLRSLGLEPVRLKTKSNSNVVFGKVKYMGAPNQSYVDDGMTDEGVNVNIGDILIMRRVSDIPLQYDLHAKIDGGAKYYRVQRRSIFAKI